MNKYHIDGPIRMPEEGMATIITGEGHELFVVYEKGKLTVHIESEAHGGSSDNSLATVTENGWLVSHG